MSATTLIERLSRWRHKKRGTIYDVLTLAEVQASTGPIAEGETVVVYRGGEGKVWVRRQSEFVDGRFEKLPDA